MDRSTLSIVLWVVAALVLVLYLVRRRKRKLLR
jgi:MYXO-CTERM domain-containing protein